MSLAELKTFIPEGHQIVMMLGTKEGCRVFTSSRPDVDGWEHEVLIPAERLRDKFGPHAVRPRRRPSSRSLC